jgi:hypothetical protein
MKGANVGSSLVRRSFGEGGLQATTPAGDAGPAARSGPRREPHGQSHQPAGSSKRPADRGSSGVTLKFHIGRMTLPGMSRADTTRVVEAIKKELAKLANKFPGRTWQDVSAVDRLDGGSIRAGARPEQVGEHLAAQIFRRLSR